MKPVIIWDWDNTLTNTKDAVTAGLWNVVNHFDLPDLTEADVHNVMTVHRGDFWTRHFGDDVMRGINYYVSVYPKNMDLIRLFPETEDVLQWVADRKIPQIILSNKAHANLECEVERMGIGHYFTRIVGSDEINGGKPEVRFAEYALNGIDYDRVILIGDGLSDMLMAKAIGATSICVWDDLPEGVACDYRAKRLSDVVEILKGILSNG